MLEHELSITKQAKALRISRGSVYYLRRPVSATDLEIMRLLDRLHLDFPFAGSRMLQGLLAAEGCKVGRRHVKTLMKRMGIEALYRRPRTTKPEPGHRIYPYLLRGMKIVRPTKCGRWISLTSRWRVASSIWPSCSTGSAVACCRGAYRSRWKRHSASKRWRMLWPIMASQHLQHGPGLAVHRHGVHRRAHRQRHCYQHGRQGRLAGQRVRRTLVAQRQVRGGLSASLRQRQNDVEGNRALICETDDLRIAYVGPFRWAAEIPWEMKHFAAAISENGPLPHKLTVWA